MTSNTTHHTINTTTLNTHRCCCGWQAETLQHSDGRLEVALSSGDGYGRLPASWQQADEQAVEADRQMAGWIHYHSATCAEYQAQLDMSYPRVARSQPSVLAIDLAALQAAQAAGRG